MRTQSTKLFILNISLLLLFPIAAQLQTRAFFSVSASGTFSTGAVSNTQAYNFNNSNNCLVIKSGLSMNLGTSGLEKFVMTCTFKNHNEDIELKLYPNPLSTRGHLISASMLGNEPQLRFSIIDNSGRVMMSFQRTSLQLAGGIEFDAQQLIKGNYFLKIDGVRFHRVIQFLKLN